MVTNLAHRVRSKLGWGNRRPFGPAEAHSSAQQEVVSSEFDASFYAIRYPEVKGDPLEHFITEGWRKENDPTSWFSTSFYLQTYPDVAAAGLNPFYHYVEHGRAEGRAIAPAEPLENPRAWEIEIIRSGLDEDFYIEQLRGRDLNSQGMELAVHYWREGAMLELDPAHDFSTSHYLETHADVRLAGVNPFAHYLARGKIEGRSAQPASVHSATPKPGSDEDHGRDLMRSEFDGEFYLASYRDVAAAGVDPLEHFLATGWKEGRNPNLWFSVTDYLDLYPDVAGAGINPFLHYLAAGRSEGRVPRHELGFRFDVIKSLQPLEERIQHMRNNRPRFRSSPRERLGRALAKAQRLESKGLYISVSHDDFTENFGGVQLVLMRESAAVDRMGYDHLHLFPAIPLQIAELEEADPMIGIVLNRERIGFWRASDIEQEIRAIATKLSRSPFVIHSLIGHRAEAIVSILQAAGCQSGWYWIHDYSSSCTGYTLLRNDVEFCGAPNPSSTACSICVYGGLRSQQIEAHQFIFKKLDLTVLAPSESALDVWKAGFAATAPAKVHEHLRISVSATRRRRQARTASGKTLRVAYVGQPVTHKGWPAFRELAMRFSKDPRFQFYHVGKNAAPGVPVVFKEVTVGLGDLDAMVRALSELEIDVAVLWSLWPETFCIAAVEALRAGAAVLTFKDSGNVAALVRKTGFGSVLGSEEELIRLFESGEVIDLVAMKRPRNLKAEFSNMTADFIEERAA